MATSIELKDENGGYWETLACDSESERKKIEDIESIWSGLLVFELRLWPNIIQGSISAILD